MTWVRIDDKVASHPKTLAAGVDAFGLWVLGVAYCNLHTTDGRIHKSALRAVCPLPAVPTRTLNRLAVALVETGRWHDDGDHWLVHGYEVEQEEALSWKKSQRREKEAAKKRQQRATEATPKSNGNDRETKEIGTEVEENAQGASNDYAQVAAMSPRDTKGQFGASAPCPISPDPTRPDPGPPVGPPVGDKPKRRSPRIPIPDDWAPTDDHRARCRESGVDCDREAERFRLHAEANDVRHVRWGAAFTTWILKALEFGPRQRGQPPPQNSNTSTEDLFRMAEGIE